MGIIFEGDELIKKENSKTYRKVTYLYDDYKVHKNYELIEILEFDSSRKRMSVIVKHSETDMYMLYTKGADTEMFKKSSSFNEKTKFEACLKNYSEQGWRTLVFAYKILTKEQFDFYDKLLNDARNDILKREQRLQEAYNIIETGNFLFIFFHNANNLLRVFVLLIFLEIYYIFKIIDLIISGVTAVEDKLQEDVAETIKSLREAGKCLHLDKKIFYFYLFIL